MLICSSCRSRVRYSPNGHVQPFIFQINHHKITSAKIQLLYNSTTINYYSSFAQHQHIYLQLELHFIIYPFQQNATYSMLPSHSFPLLQQLRTTITEISLINAHPSHPKTYNFTPTHLLHNLQQIQSQLTHSYGQHYQFLAKITAKILSVKNNGQTQNNKTVDLPQIEYFIQEAMARQKLAHLQFNKTKAQILSIQAEVVKFPALQKQIEQRARLCDEISAIGQHLCNLQQKLSIQPIQSDKTLQSISKRLNNIIQSITQSQAQPTHDKKAVSMSAFVKQHKQSETILNLIYQGNACILEEAIQKIQNGEIKRIAGKIANQIRRFDCSIVQIYGSLQVANKTNRLVCQNFLNSINYLNLNKKLKECEKLIAFIANNQLRFPQIKAQSECKVEITIPDDNKCVSLSEDKVEQISFEDDIQLLRKEEIIYSLQQEIQILKQKNSQLLQQNTIQTEAAQKSIADSGILQSELQQAKLHNLQLIQNYHSIKIQLQRLNNALIQSQCQTTQLNLQLSKSAEQLGDQRRVHQAQLALQTQLKQLNTSYLDQLHQKDILIQSIQHETTLLQQSKQQSQIRIQSFQQEVIQLHQSLQQIQQTSKQLVNLHFSTLSVCIFPTPNPESCYLQNQAEKIPGNQITFEQALSQHSIRYPQDDKKDKTGKLNIKHSKSFSAENGIEFMSWMVSKKDDQSNLSNKSVQSDQIHKLLAAKDKTIKKYEAFINKYRIQAKKYQKQILELQAKTKRLELQNLQLSQIVQEQNTHKELLAIEEQPNEIHNLSISEQLLEESNVQKLTEKQVELRVKQESINFKIEGIINTVLQLNAFKTQPKQSTQTSIIYHDLQQLGLDAFNPETHP